MNKRELRQKIRIEKRRFSQQELAEASLSVIRNLMAHPRMMSASTVMMYYSLCDEVCTHAAIDHLVADGKTVVLPVVVGDGLMVLRRYTGRESLKRGAYGIMEPVGELFTAVNTIDLIVVPGMAFDDQGHRLGRGKGYYDRFLASTGTIYKIGICFDFQRVTHVPAEEHDVSVDEVL